MLGYFRLLTSDTKILKRF